MNDNNTKDRQLERLARVIHAIWMDWKEHGGEWWCDTRIIAWFVSDQHVVEGWSSKLSKDVARWGEHVVPRLELCRICIEDMYNKGSNVSDVVEFLRRALKIVYITTDEQKRLDCGGGLKTGMPQGWNPETGDVFARLTAADISFTRERPW